LSGAFFACDRINVVPHQENACAARGEILARRTADRARVRWRWTPRGYASLAREGYTRNSIVYRAVRMIAESIGSLCFVLYDGATERDTHPLLDLVRRPNPRQDGASFLEAVASYLLLAGNAYIEAVTLSGEGGAEGFQVRELYALRPDRMKLVAGADGWPQAYDYTVGGRTVRFDQSATLPPILHLTFFNPVDDHYGMSPIEAAAVAIDTHNAAAGWNKALLDNAARPSGALVYAGADGTVLTDAQHERIKQAFAEQYQGAANAGRPLVLEGGLDWKPMSLTPRDMDFLEAKHAAAREIALAFGVPPMLLAIPGDTPTRTTRKPTAPSGGRACFRRPVAPIHDRFCGNFHRARRSRTPRLAAVGGVGERARLVRAARACRRQPPFRRFRARARALQRALRARKAGSAPPASKRRSPGCPGPLCGPPAS
jgi:HK97 family phage portal protein